ncbi:MAG TPA: 30S ribosomal protein S8 [Candidatus Saccharimonadales bacterium]|nr:30S ribosomal protein S8 [Candidatus Saccharimonadales bacterium]
MTTDNISSMLSSIKNAAMAGKTSVEVMHTKECEEIAKLIKEKGFADSVKTFKEAGKAYKMLHIDLAYENGAPKVTDLRRVSKPGRRIYKKSVDIKRVVGGYGFSVISTPRGIMADNEARKRKLGGEVVCMVY